MIPNLLTIDITFAPYNNNNNNMFSKKMKLNNQPIPCLYPNNYSYLYYKSKYMFL